MSKERSGFADVLKSLREQAGLSQPVLAQRSGVAVSTIRHFEYGIREPTYGTLVKLAHGLGVSLAAFEQAPIRGPAGSEKKPEKKPGGRPWKGK